MGKRDRSYLIRRAARTALIDSLESRLLFAAAYPEGFGEALVADSLISPTSMAFAPDGRLFVTEKGGAVRIIKNGALLPTPFLTVPVSTPGERGLSGLTFDPHFDDNGYVYIYYSAETPVVHNRVSRFTAAGDLIVPGSEQVLLDLPAMGGSTTHNGGAMQFAPDGTLLIGVGDHSYGPNAQNLNVPFGKILRINSDGSIPFDNPFLATTTGINQAIWALGLRNPFTMTFQPGTGRLYINDVGNMVWEEINEGAPGANYGWITTEGPFDPAAHPTFTNPIHAYNHDEGFAITGGAFYNPQAVQFPAQYVGQYFFADYVTGFIRRINPVTKVVTPFATDLPGPVDLDLAPDGSLYYLSRGTNAIYRISATSAPQVAQQPQGQLISAGESVTFSIVASGAAPLSYQWQRDGIDIAGATEESFTFETTLADSGAQFKCVVTNVHGSTISNPATLTVTSDQPPVPTITTPTAGTKYRGGQTITFAGSAADNEDGTLPASAMTWWVDFHHDTHTHPAMAPISGVTGGSFDAPLIGETAANVFYRIYLSVTDSAGFTRVTTRDVMPQIATITLRTSHAGLGLNLDGQPRAMPLTISGVSGMVRLLQAPELQVVGGISYDFLGWSDSGGATHNIVSPDANTTYTASYQPFTEYQISDRPWTSATGPTPARDMNAVGTQPPSIDGVIYPKGLGVSAISEITYALDGAFSKFISQVGRDDVFGNAGSVVFQVWVDGNLRYDSGVITGSSPGQSVIVDLTGGNELKLVMTDADDGVGGDQGTWGNARLVKLGAAVPDAPTDLAVTAPRYNRALLTWVDRSSNEAGFVIERSIDGVSFEPVGSVPAGGIQFIDPYRTGSTTYHYRVRATNTLGDSAATPAVPVTTPAGTLPADWSESDMGTIPAAVSGSADFDAATGTYTVRGAGEEMGNEADSAHFVYRTLTGDGRIVARVTSMSSDVWEAKAGVMMRESLDPTSRSFMTYVASGASAGFHRRNETAQEAYMGITFVHPEWPHWIQVKRVGDEFTTSWSYDGVNWYNEWTHTVEMSSTLYVGLVVTAATNTQLNTVTFDNVILASLQPTIATPPTATPNPVTTTTANLSVLGADDAGESNLSYTWSAVAKPAGAADPTFSSNGNNAARDTTATFSKAGLYELRVRISDGTGFVDATVSVTVAQTLSSVAITPPAPTIARGSSLPFAAVARDQFGDAMPTQPTFDWTVTTGGGSITAEGVYTAPTAEGSATITATIAGDTLAGSANVTIVRGAPTIVQAPAATPNPAIDVATLLSVLGEGDLGVGELTYTWAATALPAGATVLFSVNGTTEAKNTTATFSRAGSYTFSVTVADGTQSTAAEMTVVVQQSPGSIGIAPGNVQVAPNESRQYDATVYDQFGDLMSVQPAVEWSVTGDGSISASGLYTAGVTHGTYQVTATVPASGGGTPVSESVEVIVDLTAPTAVWTVIPPPHFEGSEWLFQVTYTDAHGVDADSLGNDDILITAPTGAAFAATLVGVDAPGHGSPRVVTYRLNLAGGVVFGEFGPQNWSISTGEGAVSDTLGNAVASADIGSFQVTLPFARIDAGGTVSVCGTDAADLIAIGVIDGQLTVTVNGASLAFDAATVTDVQVASLAGDDVLNLSNLGQRPLDYVGGAGSDTIHVLSGVLELRSDAGAGGANVVVSVAGGASVLFTGVQHLAALTLLGDASASIVGAADATPFAVGVNTLALDAASRLDIGTGALIVHNGVIGSADGNGGYNGLMQYVAAAYNFGEWNGPGITSSVSEAAGDGLTGVGLGVAADIMGLGEGATGTWRGHAVTGSSILITYTYAGDANLDGQIDAGDYGILDYYVQVPGAGGYAQGDFNFDGFIDPADFGLLDVNVQAQGPQLNVE